MTERKDQSEVQEALSAPGYIRVAQESVQCWGSHRTLSLGTQREAKGQLESAWTGSFRINAAGRLRETNEGLISSRTKSPCRNSLVQALQLIKSPWAGTVLLSFTDKTRIIQLGHMDSKDFYP